MTFLRGILSAILLVVGLGLVGVGVPTLWADRNVIDSDRWTDAVAPLIREPVVRDDVARALADPIADRLDLDSTLRTLLLRATERVVATDTFADVWRTAVRTSHDYAVDALRDKRTGVSVAEDGVVIDRADLVEALRPRLAEAGVPFADDIPAGEGTIVLAEGPEVERAADVGRFVDTVGPWALVAGVVVLVVGVLLARRRALALVVAGLGTVVVAAVLWFGLGLGRDSTGPLDDVDGQERTAELVWAALSTSLEPMVLTTAAVGGAVGVLGLVAWLVGRSRGQGGATRRYA